MAEIPRVPQVIPSPTVGQPVHRIAGPGDRPPPRRDPNRQQNDLLDLHEEEEAEAPPKLTIETADDEGHLDIAV